VGDERAGGPRGLATVAGTLLATSAFVRPGEGGILSRPRNARRSIARRKRMRLVEQVPGYVIRGWGDCGLGRTNALRTLAVLH
jgi:hypothetical protein